MERTQEVKQYAFLLFIINQFAERENQLSRDVYQLFNQRGILSYLQEYYDDLHTQGAAYVLGEITEILGAV